MFTYNTNRVKTPHNVSLFFRNKINYPYRNIYILLDILHNNDVIKTDTLQYEITDKYGRWYGRGIGDTKDNYFLFEQNLEFQNVGVYTFNITHGMRNNPLLGCDKIGLKISEND
jgi:gliding motility-associated lipoprotein GldH